MVRFDVITLFPEMIETYCATSIVGRAQLDKIITVKTHDLRAYGEGRHRQVDDKPYGGGAGMVMQVGPLVKAAHAALKRADRKRTKTILFSAKGRQFNQRFAWSLSKNYTRIVMICGRYEGIDERVRKILKAEEVSMGPYVLTDGDVPALAVISAVTRLLPGVITSESLVEESFSSKNLREPPTRTPCARRASLLVKEGTRGEVSLLEYPHYTRPEVFVYGGKSYRVPRVLLSGNHKAIEEWRSTHRVAVRKSK